MKNDDEQPDAEHGGPATERMFGKGLFHHPYVLVQMVDFDVQVASLNNGFPKEKEEEKHDQQINVPSIMPAKSNPLGMPGWSVKEHLRPHQ